MRIKMPLMGLVVVPVLTLAVAAPVLSQEQPAPLTWVAYTRVKPGKTQDWVKTRLKYDKPILDALVADGSVQSWGHAVRATHRPGYEWNVLTWVTTPDWAGIGKWMSASMQAMQSRSAEENAEAEQMMTSLEEEGSHFDEVVRAGFASFSTEKFNFIYTGHYRAKPGKSDAATQLFKDVLVPAGDKLLADGTLTGYGLHLQELHGQHQPDGKPWSHRTWFSFADLGSMDRLQAAFAAGMTPEAARRRAETLEFKAHHDDLFVVLHSEAATE